MMIHGFPNIGKGGRCFSGNGGAAFNYDAILSQDQIGAQGDAILQHLRSQYLVSQAAAAK